MEDFHCSFCGRRRREVVKLIAGPRVFICNECVALCVDIVKKEKEKAASSKDAPPDKKAKSHDCTFCVKPERDVDYLIAGPTDYICDSCVGLCVDIIEEEIAAQKPPPA